MLLLPAGCVEDVLAIVVSFSVARIVFSSAALMSPQSSAKPTISTTTKTTTHVEAAVALMRKA